MECSGKFFVICSRMFSGFLITVVGAPLHPEYLCILRPPVDAKYLPSNLVDYVLSIMPYIWEDHTPP